MPARVPAKATGPVVYYRDPDGKPDYAAEPKRTADGRDYRAVHASEDVRFDEPDEAEAMPDAGHGDMAMGQATTPAGARKVRFYRNPMGLPDTSPIPKKDSMGMDYLPVYEGEDTDDGTVRISPGKLQRTGVRTAVVERRVLSMPVRAPGAIEEDERRISVIAMRTDAFIEKVEAVTTGDHVHKGQPLLRLFSPEMNAAAAQYLTGIGYEGARRRLENLGIPPEVIDEIERTRKVPSTITWSAPRDGVVVERNVSDGMRAKSGDTLFKLVDHLAGLGPGRRDRTRPGGRGGGPDGDRARPDVPGPRLHRRGDPDLPAPRHGDPDRPPAHRVAEPERRPAPGDVRRRDDRHRQRQAGGGGARRRRHRHRHAGRSSCSTGARAASSRGRSGSAPAATATSRSATASSPATAW